MGPHCPFHPGTGRSDMKIRDILRTKGQDVIQIAPDDTVSEAVRVLAEHRIGCLVATRDGEIWGVVSERDVMNLLARDPEALTDTPVSEIMTHRVHCVAPSQTVDAVMSIMTERRLRHLLGWDVVEPGRDF